MFRAIKSIGIAILNIAIAMVGIMLCWVPVFFAVYDSRQRDAGDLSACLKREWKNWWVVCSEIQLP